MKSWVVFGRSSIGCRPEVVGKCKLFPISLLLKDKKKILSFIFFAFSRVFCLFAIHKISQLKQGSDGI